jgi:antitoxin component YwqK of YwqJK toxin-antitoxin module
MIRYYSSGARELLATYKDGQLEGEFTGWFEDGQVSRKRSYKNAVLLSLANYYPDGQIIGEVIVENGLIVEGIYYHQNGQIRSKGKFINEIKVGIWLQYDTLGNPTDTTDFNLTN